MAKLYEIIEEIRIKLLLRKILVLLYVFYNLLLILTFSPIFSYGLQKKKKKKEIGDDILKCGAINRAKRGILISLELNNIRV